MFLNLLSEINIHAVLGEHRRMGFEKAKLVGTSRDMDEIHILFYRLAIRTPSSRS